MNHYSTLNKAKVMAIGNSAGITLPKEVLTKLRVSKGDYLNLVETPDGILLTPYDSEFAKAMDAAEIVMRENRDALRELAK